MATFSRSRKTCSLVGIGISCPFGVYCVGSGSCGFSSIPTNPNEVMTGPIQIEGSFFPGEPLADTWRRLDWSESDGKALQRVLESFQKTDPYAIGTKFNGERWEGSFHRLVDPRVELKWFDQMSRLLGSYVDNLRAALNYLTYQTALLALREDPSLTDLRPESVEFPIFLNPADYSGNRIKKLPNKFQGVFRSVQPDNSDFYGLWPLHELARESRHRIVHPVAMVPFKAFHGAIVNGQPTDAFEVVYEGPLINGKVVMLIDAPEDADVHAKMAISPGIQHSLCEGQQMMDVVNEMGDAVRRAVIRIETTHFSSNVTGVAMRDGRVTFTVEGP